MRKNVSAPDGRKYVDLGLPSGRLWAAENEVPYLCFDAARTTYGDLLPPADAWQELHDHCKWKWDEHRKGYLVTAVNGDSIFLPAAGFRNDVHIYGRHTASSVGLYWSSTAHDVICARHLCFGVGYVHPLAKNYRYWGLSIRLCKQP